MRYIEAPAHYEPHTDELSLFLAGGITGCEDWQAEATRMVSAAPVVVLNPRRALFDRADPGAAAAQIAWEVTHLRLANVTLFWFPACDPAVTVQPIALLELGGALADAWTRGRRLAVGTDPGYPRRFDVVEQCRHAAPGLTVHEALHEVVSDALMVLAMPGAGRRSANGS